MPVNTQIFFNDFQDFLKQIYMGGRQISDSLVQKLLSETKLTLNGRQDVLPSVHKSFVQLTLELVLSLCKCIVYQLCVYT
ncbi:hypothetical protein DPMN_097069 [Dreissena polymorpha]|uniref:Uncharacterized protein n=1 Tax=Dreissena polymorpha TaxID=45954 RepID=A0A9D4LAE9_DREPO|nr:hypothetical protein DPMN_097069 [Dreissena polymorpha]